MKKIISVAVVAALSMTFTNASAGSSYRDLCPISQIQLDNALASALAQSNGGLDYDMWATVINRQGDVCAVTKVDGLDEGTTVDPWPGSRVISAQKANTANAFSNENLALSTANTYSAVQPGGSLYGLQHSNPVDVSVAYRGNASRYGTRNDPMRGRKIGGVNVFGGGLPLYDVESGELVGAVGVSGDTSCADHNIAMRTRAALGYDWGTAAGIGGIDGQGTDNINYDNNIGGGLEVAFNHPICGFNEPTVNDEIMTSLGVSGFAPAPVPAP